MKSKDELKIVFMGTPSFAVGILEQLINEKYTISAVITAPDRPAGRGKKVKQSDVKQFALEKEIELLQPLSLKDEDFLSALKQIQADLFIVVAFRMLPKEVWQLPKYGTFNLHASLLPEYRGAAPINWAIINGETQTGVTTFFIDEKIDTGEIILNEKIQIGENETAGELHDRLMVLGANVVVKTVELIRTGQIQTQSQPTGDFKPAPKIFKNDCEIDFKQTISNIHNFIRGLSPYPTAWFQVKHIETDAIKSIKVFQSSVYNKEEYNEVSFLVEDFKLLIQTYQGTLELKEIQLEGKKRMDAKSFLLGFKPEEWKILSF